jgi:hypothetical protein
VDYIEARLVSILKEGTGQKADPWFLRSKDDILPFAANFHPDIKQDLLFAPVSDREGTSFRRRSF